MEMTKYDEYKDLLDEKFKSIHLEMSKNFDLINQKLDTIETAVNKTNGRVSKLEEEVDKLKINDITHINNCPFAPKIEKIKDDLEEYRVFKKYPKLMIGTLILSIAIYLVTALFEMIKLGVFTK